MCIVTSYRPRLAHSVAKPMDAQQAIEVQTAGEPPGTVTELFLSGCTVPGLEELSLERLSLELVPFVNLRILSLNCCNIGSLESFPVLPNLRLLELADNQLTGKPACLASHLAPRVISVRAVGVPCDRRPRTTLRRLAPRAERAQPRREPDRVARRCRRCSRHQQPARLPLQAAQPAPAAPRPQPGRRRRELPREPDGRPAAAPSQSRRPGRRGQRGGVRGQRPRGVGRRGGGRGSQRGA